MKSLQGQAAENTLEILGFEVLTTSEMNEVKGGIEPRPKTRDKDIFDIDVD